MEAARSWNPAALLSRILKPGILEMGIAGAHHQLGELDQSLVWLGRARRKCRLSWVRGAIYGSAARIHAQRGDHTAVEEELRCLQGVLLADAHAASKVSLPEVTAGVYAELGCLDRAVQVLASAPATDYGRPEVRFTALQTVLSLAWDDAFLSIIPPSRPRTKQKDAREGLSRIRAVSADVAKLGSFGHLAERLIAAGRWEVVRSYIAALGMPPAASPPLRALALGLHAIEAGHDRDRHVAEERLRELETLRLAHPRHLVLQNDCDYLAAIAWCELGEPATALASLDRARLEICSPHSRAERLHLRAEILESLGRSAEADQARRESLALCPLASWNRSQDDAESLPEQVRESIATVMHRLRAEVVAAGADGEGSSVGPGSETPAAPVASAVGPWAWALAVFAFVPVLGVVPGVALLTLGAYLLLRRPALPHDRRAGIAGLVLGLLSMGFAGLYVGHWVGLWKPAASYQTDMEESPALTDEHEADAGLADQEGVEDRFASEEYEDGSAGGDRPKVSITWPVGILYFVVLILSIMFHELGHALSAYWAGDPTARDRGRLSLNPIRHLSLFGSFIVPLVLILLPGDAFIGWAKPVPVTPGRMRRPRLGRLGVSLAGVSTNLILAFLAANVLAALLIVLGLVWPGFVPVRAAIPFTLPLLVGLPHETVWTYVIEAVKATVFVNVFLAWFNLLPVPPLDGYGAIRSVLPVRLGAWLDRMAGFGTVLLLGLVALNLLTYVLVPAIVAAIVLLHLGTRIAGW
ncbi:MAG: site-2 protease family protein [Phycisphaerae bacterium]|nr:site-2 protease family protein [Phycisphaerae bacterium]